MRLTRATGRRISSAKNQTNMPPKESFYDLSATLNDGALLNFGELRGKKVLIVNTASDCGFTNQYGELQQLHERYKDRLVVIGFPANDFKEQEKGSDEEIASFCKKNFGVTFPLAKKTAVTGEQQNKVFRWLSDEKRNGWNNHEPGWNFSKYLVSESGVLLNCFDPGISPLSKAITNVIEQAS
jgi:glutathione peroxidase